MLPASILTAFRGFVAIRITNKLRYLRHEAEVYYVKFGQVRLVSESRFVVVSYGILRLCVALFGILVRRPGTCRTLAQYLKCNHMFSLGHNWCPHIWWVFIATFSQSGCWKQKHAWHSAWSLNTLHLTRICKQGSIITAQICLCLSLGNKQGP